MVKSIKQKEMRGFILGQKVKKCISKGEVPDLKKLQMEVGYSEKSALSKTGLMSNGFKKVMEPFLKQLKDKRDNILSFLTDEKLNDSTARDVVYVMDLLNKNTQLLEDKPTEKVIYNFNNLEEAEKYLEEELKK